MNFSCLGDILKPYNQKAYGAFSRWYIFVSHTYRLCMHDLFDMLRVAREVEMHVIFHVWIKFGTVLLGCNQETTVSCFEFESLAILVLVTHLTGQSCSVNNYINTRRMLQKKWPVESQIRTHPFNKKPLLTSQQKCLGETLTKYVDKFVKNCFKKCEFWNSLFIIRLVFR